MTRSHAFLAAAALALAGAARAQDLVAHYRLDSPSGPTAIDASPNGLHGEFFGAVQLGQPSFSAQTNSAVGFDGATSRVRVANVPALGDLRDDLTVAAWINPSALVPWQRVLGNRASWAFGLSGDRILFTTRGIKDYFSPPLITTGTWAHVAVVFDASRDATFYLDGASVGYVPGNQPANAPATFWFVGALQFQGEVFNGLLDEVQVYDGALDAAAIAFLASTPGATWGPGSTYCLSTPNSSGRAAMLTATGSTSLSANDLRFSVSPLPPQRPGLIVTSPDQASVPLLNGNLCLGNATLGFVSRLPLGTADTAGLMTHALDVLAPTTPLAQITIGSTWCFQAWFHDPAAGGARADFSSAVQVTFGP